MVRHRAQPEGPVTYCGGCWGKTLVTVLDLGDQPLPQATRGRESFKRYPLRLVKCPDCTLVQLDYIVPQTETFPPEYPYVTGLTAALREHFAEQAMYVEGLISRGDTVVDIGGNDGTMLKSLRTLVPAESNRLMLVEPTDQAKKCDDPSIRVVQAYFTGRLGEELAAEYGVAKVITASNVFGHVPDPYDFLDGCFELLAPDGVLIIDNQDWYNVVQDLQIDTVYHEHLRYYSPASFSFIMARAGFLVTSINRIGMHGGSFRATAVKEEQGLGARANQLLINLHNMVAEAARKGPVYAVSAPTRATPLVNASGIGPYLTCACEISGSEKIGAVIPGTDMQIVDEEKLFTGNPPTAILLAWDLAGTLIPKLRAKGYHGDIIVPLPEPRVIGNDLRADDPAAPASTSPAAQRGHLSNRTVPAQV